MADDAGWEDWPEDDVLHYCPHGEQVPTSGGACARCAQEDADEGDQPW